MSNLFHGNHVLVTGADGFIGSHLTELLVSSGAKVRALVYYNSWNQIGWLNTLSADILSDLEIISGDIRDPDCVNSAVEDCAYVFHLASLIAIPYSYHAPRSYIDTNVGGAINIAQACRDSDTLERLVHTSTSEVYGSAQTIPINEKHPLVAQSPYSASKIAADKIIESFNLSFGIPTVIARPFNTFGPRQTARAVIPTIASQLLSGCSELRVGSLSPTRDFVYVTDTANALISLSQSDSVIGKVLNIGTGKEWSIEEVVNKLIEITGHSCPVVSEDNRFRPPSSEVNRLVADTTLIGSYTSWQPKVEFQDGIQLTLEWISENLKYFNPGSYSR